MKIDLTSLSFNSNLAEGVGTPSWGTALGQSEGYNITVNGAEEILLGMFNNKIDEAYIEHNLRGEKDILLASIFQNVSINGIKINKPFILAIVEEHSKSHDGRKALKYNDKFKYSNGNITYSNDDFYQEAQRKLGENKCWFAYEINIIKGKELNIKAKVVSDNTITYIDSKQRKDEWSKLINDTSTILDGEIIIRNKAIGQFVYDVIEFLVEKKNIHALQKYLVVNSDNRYSSLTKDDKKLTSIFWLFEQTPGQEDLYQGGKLRAFEKLSFELSNYKYYLSKEWTDKNGHRLDISNFAAIFNTIYSGMQISKLKDEYILELSNTNKMLNQFLVTCNKNGLMFKKNLVARFTASLFSKPFLICSGLSGSGKTKLAQAFVQWICKDESQYKIVPVGSDWTNREPLLGYPNGLNDKTYVMPDSGVLKLMINATENSTISYFIILDEMNLSHVERYFADFLSIMESKDTIMLYDGNDRTSIINDTETKIPNKIAWPENLFIIGTVNIDETTYMFSPKVLDRANVIEFRISPEEMDEFLKNGGKVNMDDLFIEGKKENGGLGQNMVELFLKTSENKDIDQTIDIDALSDFFRELQNVGAEFGYRTATEIKLLITHLKHLNYEGEVIDVAIMQKLLPKLHGSRKKIITPLETLAGFCLDHGSISENKYIEYCKNSTGFEIKYPLSFAKIERMIKNAIENGYTSYAEA